MPSVCNKQTAYIDYNYCSYHNSYPSVKAARILTYLTPKSSSLINTSLITKKTTSVTKEKITDFYSFFNSDESSFLYVCLH